MAKEIERKFIVNNVPKEVEVFEEQNIIQNYLTVGEEEVRIRKKFVEDEYDYTLCIKRGMGLEREEITHEISSETYQNLASLCTSIPIKKRRLLIKNGIFLLEVDVYENENLIVAEVEFDSVEAANSFQPPNWFLEEVTFNNNYKNQNLWERWNSEKK